MKLIHYDSSDEAYAASAAEALARGCNPDNTKYWWSVSINDDGSAELQMEGESDEAYQLNDD